MQKLLYVIEVLSLDICVGVLGSGALARYVLKSNMKCAWWLLLPASVWVVYTADHLMDARKVGVTAKNARHDFHARYFRVLATTAAAMALLCLVTAVLYLKEEVVAGGLLIAGLSVMHVMLAYWGKVKFGKEVSVAVIYVCGVWLSPWINRTVVPTYFEFLSFGFFLFAVVLNLFMNSVIEYRIDRADGQVFLLESVPRALLRRLVIAGSAISVMAIFIGLVGDAMAAPPFVTRHIATSVILVLLCAAPGLILFFERFFLWRGRYRLLAEWIFAAGLFLLLPPFALL